MFHFELIIRCELRSAEVPSKWGVSKQYLCNVRNICSHANYILLYNTSVCRLPNALPDASRMSANLKPTISLQYVQILLHEVQTAMKTDPTYQAGKAGN